MGNYTSWMAACKGLTKPNHRVIETTGWGDMSDEHHIIYHGVFWGDKPDLQLFAAGFGTFSPSEYCKAQHSK